MASLFYTPNQGSCDVSKLKRRNRNSQHPLMY
uniref:Uncharacterized protein n=1 Tax=Nelumbo nucifera TaxID=4432 RepID=A0A822YCN5_NELNU|nr:TPA_asm: hypothetical protein HUJ06_030294 [Nelumbo nucifera]